MTISTLVAVLEKFVVMKNTYLAFPNWPVRPPPNLANQRARNVGLVL
jgi:hypothetical protein